MFKGLNKKGDLSDGIIFIVTLFFLAVSFIIVAFANSKIASIISDTALNQSSAAASITSSFNYLNSNGIQNGFIFIFAFLIIGMMLSSFMVRVHPGWFVLYIIFTAIAVILAVLVSNAYDAMISSDALSTIAAQNPKITWVMEHLVKIAIGAVALSLIILFAKPAEGTVV